MTSRRYHVAFTTPAAAANAAFVDIRTAGTYQISVLEIGIFATAATASTLSLERTTTIGTASTSVVPQPGNPTYAATTASVGTAWSVAPASTSVPLRQIVASANIGAGVIWTMGMDELIVPISSSIAIFNRGAGAGPISRGYFVFSE